MSDTTTPNTTPDSTAQDENPNAGLLGSLQGFFASMNPIYGFLAAATSTDIKDVAKDPTETFRTVKMDIGAFLVNSSLIVLGIVAIFFSITVAIGQDKLSAVSGLVKVGE